MLTKDKVICTINDIPMYWQITENLSESERFEYDLHSSAECSFVGVAEFMGSIAAVYLRNTEGQYVFYLDDIENSDESGYQSSLTTRWYATVAAKIALLKGQSLDFSTMKEYL